MGARHCAPGSCCLDCSHPRKLPPRCAGGGGFDDSPPVPDVLRVLIAAFDGLQPAQVSPSLTPIIHGLATDGVAFTRHHAVFPTVTRTNVASMVTGRHPGGHGLAANAVVVPEFRPGEVIDVLEPALVRLAAVSGGRVLLAPTLGEILAGHGRSLRRRRRWDQWERIRAASAGSRDDWCCRSSRLQPASSPPRANPPPLRTLAGQAGSFRRSDPARRRRPGPLRPSRGRPGRGDGLVPRAGHLPARRRGRIERGPRGATGGRCPARRDPGDASAART